MTRDRKQLPRAEREAISAEIRAMLSEQRSSGGPKWSETRLANWLGITQAYVNRAKTPDGVGPACKTGFADRGVSIDGLIAKHGIKGDSAPPTDLPMVHDMIRELIDEYGFTEEDAKRCADAACAYYRGLQATPFRALRLAIAIAEHARGQDQGALESPPLPSE